MEAKEVGKVRYLNNSNIMNYYSILLILITQFCTGNLLGVTDGSVEVELFKPEWVKFDISSRFVSGTNETNKIVNATALSPGEKIGNIKISTKTFIEIYEEAVNYDSSNDPLLGRGEVYLMKIDSERWFYVFYEGHQDNPRDLNDFRVNLKELNKVEKVNNLLVISNERGGYSFSKKLISEIKKLIDGLTDVENSEAQHK